MPAHLWDYEPDHLEATVSELLVATATSSDALVEESVREVLHELREHLRMDVMFLSEISGGRRTFKHVDAAPGSEVVKTGGSSPLEETFCQCVLDGRLPGLVNDVPRHPNFDQLPKTPFRVGAHLSAPVVLSDGRVYGTLCAFSFAGDESLTGRDYEKLATMARITAKRIDQRRQRVNDEEMAGWQLEPIEPGKAASAWDKRGRNA